MKNFENILILFVGLFVFDNTKSLYAQQPKDQYIKKEIKVLSKNVDTSLMISYKVEGNYVLYAELIEYKSAIRKAINVMKKNHPDYNHIDSILNNRNFLFEYYYQNIETIVKKSNRKEICNSYYLVDLAFTYLANKKKVILYDIVSKKWLTEIYMYEKKKYPDAVAIWNLQNERVFLLIINGSNHFDSGMTNGFW